MQRKQSRIVWLVVIIIAFFFLIDPFRLFTSRAMPQYRTNDEMKEEMIEFFRSAPEGMRFVVELAENHDIVMLAASGYRNPQFVKQEVDFVADLIPELQRAGVSLLGLEYAAKSDQDRIDALLTDVNFDVQLAREILFNHRVTAGYEEYVNLYRSAWAANRNLADDQEPFRIVALSDPPDYSLITRTQDVENPEIMQQVLRDGPTDDQIAGSLIDLVSGGEAVVVFTEAQHAFTGFEQNNYTEAMTELGFEGARTAGNTLRERFGDRVVMVAMHGPLEDSRPKSGYGYPLGGLIESTIGELEPNQRTRGFLTAEFPLSDAPIISNVVQQNQDPEILFSDYSDGYLILGRIADYTPLTPISGFVTEETLDAAIAGFPGADPGTITVAQMNQFIADTAASMTDVFAAFK
jgi:hypothetical protein